MQNAAAVARQVGGFGVDLQYAKVSVNVAVAVAATAAVLAMVMAFAGGLSLATLGPIASTARQAVLTALEGLASAAGRRALVQDVGRAVVDGAGRVAAVHTTGHHLRHEVVEEVLEELGIDVGTQAWQAGDGTRTSWDGLSTVTAGLAGGTGGAVGAGLVAPVFSRMRSTPRMAARAGLGAGGGLAARTGNGVLRHSGGLAATAGTNVVASPAGGIAAGLLTGQGIPTMDGLTFLAAALGAAGRYGTVSPTHPAVLAAGTRPMQTLTRLHVDALAGRTAQEEFRGAALDAAGSPGSGAVDPDTDGRVAVIADTAGADRLTTSRTASALATADPSRAAATSFGDGPASAGPAAPVISSAAPAGTIAGPPDVGPGASVADAVGPSAAGADRAPGMGVIAAGLAEGARPSAAAGGPVDTWAAAAEVPTPTAVSAAEQSGAFEVHRAVSSSVQPSTDHAAGLGDVPAGTSPAADVPGSTQPHAGDGGIGGDSDGPKAGGTSDADGQTQDGQGHEPAAPAEASPPPPVDPPPSAEREHYEGSPRAIQRYAIEAVAGAQPWADLVGQQLDEVFDVLEAGGFPRPEAVGTENAVKTVWSAVRKIQPPVQGGSTVASAFWAMDDLVRFAVQTDPSRYGDSVLATLELLGQHGWAAPVPRPGQPAHEDWRNTWAPGNRHFGLLVVLTHVVTGQRIEVQFPTATSWAVGKQTHEMYETFRLNRDNPLERVEALAQIREIVRSQGLESEVVRGLDKLGPGKANSPARIFEKDPELAVQFIKAAVHKVGSAETFLVRAGISQPVVEEIVTAAEKVAAQQTTEGGSTDDGSEAPGLGVVGTGAAGGRGAAGQGASQEREAGFGSAAPLSSSPGRPGRGTPRPARAARGRGPGAGGGLRVRSRDLDQARRHPDLGAAERAGELGDGPVRRAQRPVDLGPGERQRDERASGVRRGPVRPDGTGDPRGGGSSSPQEGHDAAHPRTPAGDLPEPGGPGAGHVGHPLGPGQPRAHLNGPLAVGADTASALDHVLAESGAQVLWQGADGSLSGRALLLADGSSIRVSTGDNPWATPEPDRPLQMWTVGAVHLDDGPLTPAASAFLVDLSAALDDEVGHPGPSSEWLSQRATLDPRTHRITERGVARPHDGGDDVWVWDAAQGWVDARRAGGLARVLDEGLVPASDYASWSVEPLAGEVLHRAARVTTELHRSRLAELHPGAPHDATSVARAEQRNTLRRAAADWAASTVTPALALFLDSPVHAVAVAGDRLLVELDGGGLAVVAVAVAENDALPGSRPGLQQAGTTTHIGRLRNELADLTTTEQQRAVVHALTHDLQHGTVRHFRVQGVVTDGEFVGTRVTEFEVLRPAPDEVGAPRARVEPHRHIDPGLSTREAMGRAVAGWTPTSVTDAVANASRWLPSVNPLYSAYPVTSRMPYGNNCGDCSRAVADLVQGRDVRTAFGDNGARVLDSWQHWGTSPGELPEMWRWAGTVPGWHGRPSSVSPARFTAEADTRIGQALSTAPEGTVAIVLVNWANEHGRTTGGHWFTAVVTEDGVEWIDGQSAEHHAWPPRYTQPYNGFSVITRAEDSDTWEDLFRGNGRAVPADPHPTA
ncbi:toxin glutamine deamidase domain-containing protein [Klenkia terrae]|uniref:toxin glutamine deamidase domain-containing protein n=1 Tax=Klenkia terrae TaxID=1052259 RepID=UPI00300FA753